MTKLTHAIESHIRTIDHAIRSARSDTTGVNRARFMTRYGRLATTSLLFFGGLVFTLKSGAQQRPQIVEKVAKTYGLDSWNEIEAVRYTFHLEFGALNVSRSWEWEPKTTKVYYEGKDKDSKPVKVTYMRSELSSQSDAVRKEIDPAFINDNYPLLFPLRAYWDSSATVIEQGTYNLPVGNGSAEVVAVKYPAEARGYTPGDTWQLYVGKDNRVEYIVYLSGGAKPSLFYGTNADHKKAGPLLIATDHKGTADGKPIRIWYSDVSVKLTGSDKWMDAQ